MPKVSVIIPVYNSADYLPACLDSVLRQTLTDFEVICVDDGSTDTSPEILKQYAEKDSRVRVMHQQNRYAGVARNTGMDAATGEYLYFLDSDDFIAPVLLEKTVRRARQTRADMVLFNGCRYDMRLQAETDSRSCRLSERAKTRRVFSRHDFPDEILQIGGMVPWNKLLRHSFVKEKGLRFMPLRQSNDVSFMLGAASAAERIAWVDELLVTHRVGTGTSLQSTKTRNPECIPQSFIGLKKELERLGTLEETRLSFARRAIASSGFALEDMQDSEARFRLCEALADPEFLATGAADFPRDQYELPKRLDQVLGCEKAVQLRARLDRGGAAEEADRGTLYEAYAALTDALSPDTDDNARCAARQKAFALYEALPPVEQYARYAFREEKPEELYAAAFFTRKEEQENRLKSLKRAVSSLRAELR